MQDLRTKAIYTYECYLLHSCTWRKCGSITTLDYKRIRFWFYHVYACVCVYIYMHIVHQLITNGFPLQRENCYSARKLNPSSSQQHFLWLCLDIHIDGRVRKLKHKPWNSNFLFFFPFCAFPVSKTTLYDLYRDKIPRLMRSTHNNDDCPMFIYRYCRIRNTYP